MLSLGFTAENILQIKNAKKPLDAFKEIIKHLPEETSLLGEKVHLYHSNAAIIEMPQYVNNFHDLFETQLRAEALKYLNDVSLKGDDPYTCLEKLCTFLEVFLVSAKEQTEKKIPLVQKLLELEATWKKLQLQVLDNQVPNKEAFMREYLRIGATIVETVALIRQLSGNSLAAPTTHLGEYFSFVNKHRSLLTERNDTPRRSRSTKFTPLSERLENAYLELSTNLAKQGSIKEGKLEGALANLENSTVVIHLLRKHSDCPPKHFLSGRCIDGTWVPFTPQEIMKQKYQIISQRTLEVIINRNPEDPLSQDA